MIGSISSTLWALVSSSITWKSWINSNSKLSWYLQWNPQDLPLQEKKKWTHAHHLICDRCLETHLSTPLLIPILQDFSGPAQCSHPDPVIYYPMINHFPKWIYWAMPIWWQVRALLQQGQVHFRQLRSVLKVTASSSSIKKKKNQLLEI